MPSKEKCDDSINFQQLIDGIRRIFDQENINPEDVSQLLAAYKSDPLDWGKYAKFDPHRSVVFIFYRPHPVIPCKLFS